MDAVAGIPVESANDPTAVTAKTKAVANARTIRTLRLWGFKLFSATSEHPVLQQDHETPKRKRAIFGGWSLVLIPFRMNEKSGVSNQTGRAIKITGARIRKYLSKIGCWSTEVASGFP